MSSSEGQKVTTDPRTLNEPKNENPGMVTSDSLAAESINEGGSFAANSDSRGPMSQPSYSTTTNNQDISEATRLDPAPDAEARQASEEWNEAAVLNRGIGKGHDEGRGPTWNTPDPNAVTETTNYGNAGRAPGYESRADPDSFQPKGKNVTEGGFDPTAPNASFNSDIGGKNDPGRVALQGFQEENVPYAGGAGPREGQISNDGQYDALKEERA